ncbi:MAG: FtsX-like permease family protein [Nitrospina sp.]|nr:FtsX-like permease family protein [Nitrospina sp.]MBT3875897.1 FtsX-like permease family protein [Nitrospina sp.]MBT4046968.1 FtsX-like permease family protein [Nitrospina sp.]MBT4557312.1 FtsX-like permease family protein [Nitrospina sp.]MBT5347584.1 FtsX-like permease family protein [Nitrospina sp.]
MLIWVLFKMALRSLVTHKLRTFLTALGIIIGVASVISMISIGEGARSQTQDTISKFGTNIITVKPGQKKSRHVTTGKVDTLTLDDAEYIKANIPLITGVAAQVYRSAQLKFENKNTNTTVRGTGASYARLANFEMDLGRYFNIEEIKSAKRICVLGSTALKNLFAGINPLGKTIKVNGKNFLVIGTTVPKGALSWFDPDDQIFIPVTTAQKRVFGIKHVQSIDVQAGKIEDLETIIEDITRVLRQKHNILEGREDDFYVQNSAQFLRSWGDSAKTFTYLLGGIAAISLMVGGIGIMNIMLVSVTERTREIGIRKALGAKKKEILEQFLIESVLISFLGGGIGILLGIGISRFVSDIGGWETIVSTQSIILSFGFSVAIGIFFGFYPANKAANLNPIDALRYE